MPRFWTTSFARRRARELRANMTEEEVMLWVWLREMPVKFRRQVPLGPYICDFVAYGPRLVVEVDGEQHADSEHDRVRDAYLRRLGFRVLRVWTHEVRYEIDQVLDDIALAVDDPTFLSP